MIRECRSRLNLANDGFWTRCLQVDRLIVSAPGDSRLSANFSVFEFPPATSLPG